LLASSSEALAWRNINAATSDLDSVSEVLEGYLFFWHPKFAGYFWQRHLSLLFLVSKSVVQEVQSLIAQVVIFWVFHNAAGGRANGIFITADLSCRTVIITKRSASSSASSMSW